MKINIETSARHAHLCRADVEKLFGKNYKLKLRRKLSQGLDFACRETLVLKNGKNKLERVRIIGPERRATQVEVTYTEARKLGIKGVLRVSGDHKGTPGITLIGKKGKTQINRGVIIAKRHLHVPKNMAKKLKLRPRMKVKVRTGGPRGVIFYHVIARIAPDFKLYMHIDTDEANSAGISKQNHSGELII